MKFFLTLSLAAATAAQAATLIESHVDVRFDYNAATETWTSFLQYGGTANNPTITLDPELGALPARDMPFPSGERSILPASGFEFTGAPGGQPLWIYPQSNSSYTWPGFDNKTALIDAYLPSDPRVSTAGKWIKIQLISVEYSGAHPQVPHFSLWSAGSFGERTIWMTSSDGISSSDLYYLAQASHAHLNWGFTALGIYRVTLRPSALAGGVEKIGVNTTVTFAVGTLARWRALHFTGADITDPNTGVPEADPDGDDTKNLLEYAFNMNPNVASRNILPAETGTAGLPNIQLESISGQQRLTLEFVRRKSATNPQITYTPEFTSNLQATTWDAGINPVVTNIDATWERVKVIDPQVTAPGTNRFGRVKVTIQPTIAY